MSIVKANSSYCVFNNSICKHWALGPAYEKTVYCDVCLECPGIFTFLTEGTINLISNPQNYVL